MSDGTKIESAMCPSIALSNCLAAANDRSVRVDQMAIVYEDIIQFCHPEGNEVLRANRAIIERWSHSALARIKQLAWKRLAGRSSTPTKPDNPKRGTGRTTALMLHAIADALESPDQLVRFVDHADHPVCMNRTYIRCIQDTVRRLGLTIDVGDQDGRVMLRSTISMLRGKKT